MLNGRAFTYIRSSKLTSDDGFTDRFSHKKSKLNVLAHLDTKDAMASISCHRAFDWLLGLHPFGNIERILIFPPIDASRRP